MAEKRYYWMKLKEDFFSSKRIKRLRSLAGGDTYTIIYLKMQLKALKDDGILYFDGVMGSFSEELALDIDENPDDVSVVINYLASVGLLETSDEIAYHLTYLDNLIGSETAHTQRQRDYIKRKKEMEASLNDAHVTPMLRSSDAEKEIELEKEIEIDVSATKQKKRTAFVPPTREDVRSYANEKGSSVDPDMFYEYFTEGNWIDSKGNPVKNWKQKFLTWDKAEKEKQRNNKETKNVSGNDREGAESRWHLEYN